MASNEPLPPIFDIQPVLKEIEARAKENAVAALNALQNIEGSIVSMHRELAFTRAQRDALDRLLTAEREKAKGLESDLALANARIAELEGKINMGNGLQ